MSEKNHEPIEPALASTYLGRSEIQATDTDFGSSTEPGARSLVGNAPEKFGKYRIVRTLGEGGMGAVYLARDTELERDVALKLPKIKGSAAAEILDRFRREARTAATLSHPNICPMYDFGEIDGQFFLTMAYIEGEPLSYYTKKAKAIAARQAALLIRKLALALAHAHEKGIIHRDLKPGNVMINKKAEPIVMDFGLARRDSSDDTRLTRTGVFVGTPAYVSPEQITNRKGEVDQRTDIYSLGVMLYEMLAKRLPFEADSAMSMMAQSLTGIAESPIVHREKACPRLSEIAMKAISRDVTQRYQTMRELADDLTDYLKGDTRPRAGLAASDSANSDMKNAETSGAGPANPAATGTGNNAEVFQTAALDVENIDFLNFELKDYGLGDTNAPHSRTVTDPKSGRSGRSSTSSRATSRSLRQSMNSTRGGRNRSSNNRNVLAIAGGFAFILLVAFGIFLTIRTKHGTVRVEIAGNPDDVSIIVDDETISVDALGVGYKIETGPHSMSVTAPGFKTQTKEFTIKSGEEELVSFLFDSRATEPEGQAAPAMPRPQQSIARSDLIDLIKSHGGIVTEYQDANGESQIHEVTLRECVAVNDLVEKLCSVESLVSLQILDPAEPVSDKTLAALTSCKSLSRLVLHGAGTTDASLVVVSQLRSVQYLTIAFNQVTGEGFKYLRDMPELRELALGSNSLQDVYCDLLSDLVSLKVLALNDTKLSKAYFATILKMQWLEGLELGGDSLVDDDLRQLKFLSKLTSLNLRVNPVTDRGLDELASMSALNHVDLSRTNVTQAGVSKLHKELPQCRITWDGGTIEADSMLIPTPGSLGTVKIELPLQDDSVEYVIGKRVYSLADLSKPIVLSAGNHTFSVRRAGEVLMEAPLTVKAGEQSQVSIPDETRAAAISILEVGGTLGLGPDRKPIVKVEELPSEFLRITAVNFWGNMNLQPKHLQIFKVQAPFQLDLSFSSVTDEGLMQIRDFSHVTMLGLNRGSISKDTLIRIAAEKPPLHDALLGELSIPTEMLEHLRSCALVVIGATDFSDSTIGTLAGMDLYGCYLDGSSITDNGLKNLKGTKFVGLTLKRTAITDEGLKFCEQFGRLESIDLKETKVTEKGIAQLREAWPKCRIEWDGGVIGPAGTDGSGAPQPVPSEKPAVAREVPPLEEAIQAMLGQSDKWEWTEPVNLGPVVNGPGYEEGASLSGDGLELYFASENRKDSIGGRDIFMSRRRSIDSPWEEPICVGGDLSTGSDEYGPVISADGTSLYCSSYDGGSPNIRWVSRSSKTDPWKSISNARFESLPEDVVYGRMSDDRLILFELRVERGADGPLIKVSLLTRADTESQWSSPRDASEVILRYPGGMYSVQQILGSKKTLLGSGADGALFIHVKEPDAMQWTEPARAVGVPSVVMVSPHFCADSGELIYTVNGGEVGGADLVMTRLQRKQVK